MGWRAVPSHWQHWSADSLTHGVDKKAKQPAAEASGSAKVQAKAGASHQKKKHGGTKDSAAEPQAK